MESLTGILMCLNLCISSVCSPERGGVRWRGGRKGVRVEVKEGGYAEEEVVGGGGEENKSKSMAD